MRKRKRGSLVIVFLCANTVVVSAAEQAEKFMYDGTYQRGQNDTPPPRRFPLTSVVSPTDVGLGRFCFPVVGSASKRPCTRLSTAETFAANDTDQGDMHNQEQPVSRQDSTGSQEIVFLVAAAVVPQVAMQRDNDEVQSRPRAQSAPVPPSSLQRSSSLKRLIPAPKEDSGKKRPDSRASSGLLSPVPIEVHS